jgi:uncharacterized protein YkwD
VLLLSTALAVAAPSQAPAAGYGRYVAPSGRCAGDGDAGAPPAEQERTMRCLVNWARKRRGLRRLRGSRALGRSADLKGQAIVACDDFSHTACGRSFLRTFVQGGYVRAHRAWAAVGENIAWQSPADTAAPRDILLLWLYSTGHRENLFRRRWRDQGVALVRARSLEGADDVAVWVSQFGRR